MGIYGALSSAVTGLRAQAHALENISGNIANSQTTGYKRIETSFVDLIPDAPLKSQVPGAVLAQSRGTNGVQGDIQTSGTETFIALNTTGFFVVEPKVGQSDGNSVFAGTNFYSRRGDFELDKDGRLVNGAGYYLKGLEIDPSTGNISGSVPEVIQISNSFLAANPTDNINYQANLPQLPKTGAYKPTVYNSELLGSEKYASGSTSANMTGNAIDPTVSPASSVLIPGDTMTINVNGTAVTFEFTNGTTASGTNVPITVSGTVAQALASMQTQLRTAGGGAAASATISAGAGPGAAPLTISLGTDYHASFAVTGTGATVGNLGLDDAPLVAPNLARVDVISADQDANFKLNSVAGGAITVYAENGAPVNVQVRWAKVDSAAAGGKDTWNMFYMTDSTAVDGSPMWQSTGKDYTFSGSGSLEDPTLTSHQIEDLTVNGVNIGTVTLQHETNGISQFADVNGTVNVSTLNQNGYGAGEFLSVAINDNGRVTATYSNGQRLDVAQVATAQFNAENSLKRLDGGVYSSTSESGEPIFDLSGTGIIGGALEASNTDISDEFTKLIITQQAYSAGTRIVTTADEMLQEALNMIR